MRILMLGPADPAGVLRRYAPAALRADLPAGMGGTPVNELTLGYLAAGHDVTLVTASVDTADITDVSADRLRIFIVPYRRRARDRASDFFATEVRLLAEAARTAAPHDRVHAHWSYEFALAALRVDRAALVTLHDSPWTVLRHQAHPYRAVRLAMAYQVSRRARNFTAVSPYLAARWRRQMLLRSEPAIVPNIAPELPQSADGSPIGAKHPGEVHLVTVGDASSRKNVNGLVRAMPRVLQDFPQAILHCVGPGLDEGFAAACPPAGRSSIKFHGRLDRQGLWSLLGTCDLMVHPSKEECHPMALLEAMQLGMPVVAGARSGGVPWTLGDGQAGRLIDVSSPAAIAAGVTDSLGSWAATVAVGAKGRDWVRLHCSRTRVTEGYLQALAAAR